MDLGWTATNIPQAYGGLGLGYLELCVIANDENGDCCLYVVDLGGDGVRCETLNSIDPSRSLAKINFSGAAAKPPGSAVNAQE